MSNETPQTGPSQDQCYSESIKITYRKKKNSGLFYKIIHEPKKEIVRNKCTSTTDPVQIQEQKFQLIKCKNCDWPNTTNTILKHLSKRKDCNDQYSDNEKKILKEKSRQLWYKMNREHLLEKKRQNYQNKKDEISKKKKDYYQKNKDLIGQKKLVYYEKNKERIKGKKNARDWHNNILGKMAISKNHLEDHLKYQLDRLENYMSICEPINLAKYDFKNLMKNALTQEENEKVTKILEEFKNFTSEKKKEIKEEFEYLQKLFTSMKGDYFIDGTENEEWEKVAMSDREYIWCLGYAFELYVCGIYRSLKFHWVDKIQQITKNFDVRLDKEFCNTQERHRFFQDLSVSEVQMKILNIYQLNKQKITVKHKEKSSQEKYEYFGYCCGVHYDNLSDRGKENLQKMNGEFKTGLHPIYNVHSNI